MIDVKNTHVSYRVADGKLELLVWKDFDVLDSTSHSAGFSRETFKMPNGERIRWEWKLGSGAVTVNDKEFPLAEGRVILISTQGDGVQVKQVQHDLSKIEATEAGIGTALTALAKDNESVRKFVEAAK